MIGGKATARLGPAGSLLWVISMVFYTGVIIAFYSLAYRKLAANDAAATGETT
jgi:amino acid transporter